MYKGFSKFFVPTVVLFSAASFATVPEGEESSVLQNHLLQKEMNLCSEELREGRDFKYNLEHYNMDLGAIAADNAFRFPDHVGNATFRLIYSEEDKLIEIWPNGRFDHESDPLMKLEPSKVDPVLFKKIRDAKGGHVEEVMGDGTGQVPLVGVHGTSPALAELLGVNLDVFCDVRESRKSNVLRESLDGILRSANSSKPKVVDEGATKKKRKFGAPHRRH